jgi:hypothetical protein
MSLGRTILDSQIIWFLIHHAGWVEASMDEQSFTLENGVAVRNYQSRTI